MKTKILYLLSEYQNRLLKLIKYLTTDEISYFFESNWKNNKELSNIVAKIKENGYKVPFLVCELESIGLI